MEVLLNSTDLYMEVTSPGMERLIKNAAEFILFKDRMIRIWDTDVSDWVSGTIRAADNETICLELIPEEQTDGSELRQIPYSRIAKAKLLYL
jgi:ribosome maturation factor RimP